MRVGEAPSTSHPCPCHACWSWQSANVNLVISSTVLSPGSGAPPMLPTAARPYVGRASPSPLLHASAGTTNMRGRDGGLFTAAAAHSMASRGNDSSSNRFSSAFATPWRPDGAPSSSRAGTPAGVCACGVLPRAPSLLGGRVALASYTHIQPHTTIHAQPQATTHNHTHTLTHL